MNPKQWKPATIGWLKLIASRQVLPIALATALIFGVGNASAEFDPSTTSGEPVATEESPTPSPSPTEEAGVTPAGGGGGFVNNEVVVINTVDGRSAHRSGVGIARVTGTEAYNQNAASATSSCNDCRTVAVAAQAVIIQRTNASTIKPTNVALALNVGCSGCETYALAYQFVFTTDGLVRFNDGAGEKIAGFRSQIAEVAGNESLAPTEMEARIDAIVARMWSVVRGELAAVGLEGAGQAKKDRDEATEDPDPSPSPSASPSPSPSESPSPDPESSSSPAPEPSDSGSDPSPTPEASESPSPEPSPSPSPSESPSPI